ncbi:unnamed protein product [Diatraea saccharalis]|uniref:Cationic amino acid transporter n=1 Tax=Diatraea saccharalis TaxID=40085 RepID=A0A9N9MZY6_9NEOP|nr:unnamed protein product [Diatraea saccharalis]
MFGKGKPPDFLAFSITVLMMMVLVAGVKKSLFFNNVLNAINLSVWVFIMAAGLFYVNIHNWTDHRGFLPYGWSGVFSGAATCFYAFIGFDIIATTGEEANNPKRSIPLAIVLSLAIILIAYLFIGKINLRSKCSSKIDFSLTLCHNLQANSVIFT